MSKKFSGRCFAVSARPLERQGRGLGFITPSVSGSSPDTAINPTNNLRAHCHNFTGLLGGDFVAILVAILFEGAERSRSLMLL